MSSGPITSWEIDGETMETVTDFTLGGSKITADGDCSHEIKRCLLLGRKAMPLHIKKQRCYFANKSGFLLCWLRKANLPFELQGKARGCA